MKRAGISGNDDARAKTINGGALIVPLSSGPDGRVRQISSVASEKMTVNPADSLVRIRLLYP